MKLTERDKLRFWESETALLKAVTAIGFRTFPENNSPLCKNYLDIIPSARYYSVIGWEADTK